MSRSNELHVYLDGTFVGTASQRNGATSFHYDTAYLASDDPTALSLAMPLRERPFSNKVVNAWLEGLLPDSEATRRRWARQYSASPNNPFSLLRHVGIDAAGAVQILPPDVEPPDAALRTGNVDWLDQDAFHNVLRELATHGTDWNPGIYQGRWSLAGAQAKIALHGRKATEGGDYEWGVPLDSTPTTHIVKPSIAGFDNHHINEALCMRAAQTLGLPAAATELIDRDGIQAVISTRYDRYVDDAGVWRRLHQEDMCQALSFHPSQKYQSDGGPGVGEIADLFLRLDDEDRLHSVEFFFAYLAFNAIIGGTDAHAKNYSMLLNGRQAILAPLYDVASAACYPQHERLRAPMKLGNANKFLDVTAKDWEIVGKRLGMSPGWATETVELLREGLPAAFEVAVQQLPKSAQEVAGQQAERIVEHAERRWVPDQEVNTDRVLPPATQGSRF